MSSPSPAGPTVDRDQPGDAHRRRRRSGQLAEVISELLRESPVPLGAYDIIDQLKGRWPAPIAPTQVYRALRSLRTAGRVHRLASRSAFVIEQGAPTRHGFAVFLVCSGCGVASKIDADAVAEGLLSTAARLGFKALDPVVELEGHCRDCQTTSAVPDAPRDA